MAVFLAVLLALSLSSLGWLLVGSRRTEELAFRYTESLLAGQGSPGSHPRWTTRLVRTLGIRPPANSPLGRDLALVGMSATPEDLYLYKILAAGGGLLLAGLVAAAGDQIIAVLLLTCAIAAWGLPDARVRAEAKRVRREVSRQLPAFLQSLAMMTEAGLNLHPAIHAYLEQDDSALGRELRLAMVEADLGAPLAEALMRLAARCEVPELYRAVTTLVQASERGAAGVAETCRDLATEAWARRRDMARELGQQASTKMFLPLLLLILPTLFLFMIGPALYSMMISL